MNSQSGTAVLLHNALRLLEAGDTDGAALLVDTHLARHSGDAEAYNLLGLINQRRGQLQDAVAAFARARELAPREALYACNQAKTVAESGDFAAALSIVEAFLQSAPGQTMALIERALILQKMGRIDDAIAGAKMAFAFDRTSARSAQVLGTLLLKARRPADAVSALKDAVALDDASADAWVNLGVAYRETGDLAAAEASYRKALVLSPNDPTALNNLGNVLSGLNRHDDAIASYRGAANANPKYIDAQVNLANALRDSDESAEALEILERLVAAHPGHAGVLNAYGNALRVAERYDEAIEVLRRAVAAGPEVAEAHNNLGLALAVKNKLEDAEPHFRKAHELRPEHAIIANNLGALLLRMFKFQDAVVALSVAVARDPEYDEAMCNLGVAHYLLGQADEAIVIYRRVLARNPDNVFARYGLSVTLLEDQRLAEAEKEVRDVIARDPKNAMAHNTLGVLLLDQHFISQARAAMKAAADVNSLSAPIFYSNYVFASLYEPDLDEATILNIHLEYGRRFATSEVDRAHPHRNARDPGRKLVLAYLSPDFRAHSVAYFFEALLEKHDRTKFEIVLYSNTTRQDSVTDAFRKAADRWVETVGLTDEAFVERIRADGVDILVDLGGHTSGNRLPVCAKGAAPIQINYLGYPDTSAVPAVGYRISDARADPPGDAEKRCTEQLIRLRDCFHCYRPHGRAPDVAPAPHIERKYVTYASFNVLPKVNDGTIAAWSAILSSVPDSRFYIKCKQLRDESVRQRIRDDFARHGIDPNRIEMESFVPSVQDHLNQYALVDLALDTFPYNGTTTSCEAAWMGVPFLTLAGTRHSSRVGLSLLTALGLADEFAAHSVDDYVAKAVAFGRDPARLAEIRPKLRDIMARSPLRDEIGFTRTLESAYRDVWRNWCAGPETFERMAPPELRPEDSIQGVLVKTL
ncbi:MAG: tetratricopeptide repeat protein [Rhodobacteraceae bacterium]|nr:tetratricopeptide repeat protein [Paracoccaceae bacterium]